MARTIHMLPDDVTFEAADGETILAAALRAGVPHAHACGGNAHCSTCRVHVASGAASSRTTAETTLAMRLGFTDSLRLACQTQPMGDMSVRRLVLDDQDIALIDQRRFSASSTASGQEYELGILFADIRGFTAFAERLPPYDVVHVLNRYFHVMGAAIAQHGGSIDNYMGDGLLALFGLVPGETDPAVASVQAALAMLSAMDSLKPYLASAYGSEFDIRIGVHFGDVVVGTIGAIGGERITAIGDAVNFASRIESACKAADTRLLISQSVHERVASITSVGREFDVAIPGKTGTYKLHEVKMP